MKDDPLLERLARRLPGQTLNDILVEQAIEQAEPLVAEALIAAAIPTTFDADSLGALLGQPDRGIELARALFKEHSFITSTNAHYVFDETARHAILKKIWREDEDKFHQLSGAAARYFESKAAQATQDRDDTARSVMYHLLASNAPDQERGYAILLDMFEQAEQHYRPGEAFILIRLASEQRDYLTPERRVGLDWLTGRLHRLQGQPAEAIGVLRQALESNPPAEMQARLQLSLAEALNDDKQWADAILYARSAHLAFRAGHGPLDPARALIELARAYAGLARSVRGTRAVRPQLENAFLNFFYQIGVFLERLPILIYLMTQLGVRRLLPVLGRVARDQDWVVARLFGTAATQLRRAEALLQAKESPSDPRSAAELLRIEAHRTLAGLYRTLGHLSYAASLLEDLLEHVLIIENDYRMARIRLDLADILLDARRAELAAEELRAALPVFQSVKDIAGEASARYVLGNAILLASQTGLAAHSDRLTAGVRELEHSLALYTQLGNLDAQVEVARALDQAAANSLVPADHEARVRASQAAATVAERRFPIRYEHPRIFQFRTAALIGLTIAFLIIGFFSVRTESGTEVGAAALFESGALTSASESLTPPVNVELPEQQIRPRFQGGFAAETSLIVLTVYMLLYIAIGVGLVSVASLQTLREAESHFFALDAKGIRYCRSDGAAERALAWDATQEAILVNRDVYARPIASYSRLALFGEGVTLDVPGRTAGYETLLLSRITAQLPMRPRSLGFSILKSWAGVLFAATLAALLWFIVLSGIMGDIAILNVIGSYSWSDLFAFSYIGILAPLGWWLVINPLRETLTLKPASRWPWWMGGAGLVLETIVLAAPWRFWSALPHPNIYPVLIGAFLVASAALFVARARRWEGRPSNRTTYVYPALARLGAILVAALALGLAVDYGQREVRAYHALVMGNEMRDRASSQGDANLAQAAIAYYTQAITLTPHSAVAYASRGAVRTQMGNQPPTVEDYQQAIQDYDRALELGPRQTIVYANRALAYQGMARLLAPQPDRLSSAAELPASPEANQYLGKALADYWLAQALNPKDATYFVHAGVILHELGQYEAALKEYTSTLQLDPGNADAYAGRAWAYFQIAAHSPKDKPAEAPRYYLRAWPEFLRADELLAAQAAQLPENSPGRADVNRRRANIQNGLAWIAYKFRSYEYAIEFFAEASKLEPNNGDYHMSLGNLYWLISRNYSGNSYLKLIEDGLLEYEKTIALTDKASLRAYLYRTSGQFHYLLRNQPGHDYRQELEKAIAADDTAITLNNTVTEYYLRRGQIHQELAIYLRPREWETAIEHYQAAISDFTTLITIAQPGDAYVGDAVTGRYKAYAQMGWGYHVNGNDTQAISVTLQAIEFGPTYAVARFNLAVIRLYLNDVEQARRDYEQAIAVTCQIPQSEANDAYKYAKDDLGTLKSDRPGLVAVADEMVALINNARCSR